MKPPPSILRAANRPAMPWRNGGGVTREIAVSPPDTGFADFDWRISMAEVAAAGPFSRFEGVDRVLTVIAGTLSLSVQDHPLQLDAQAAPYAFPGEAECWGEPLVGKVTDLNVMLRRGRYTGRVWRTQAGGFSASADIWLFVALADGTATVDHTTHQLHVHDAVLGRQARLETITTAPGLVIELKAVS